MRQTCRNRRVRTKPDAFVDHTKPKPAIDASEVDFVVRPGKGMLVPRSVQLTPVVLDLNFVLRDEQVLPE